MEKPPSGEEGIPLAGQRCLENGADGENRTPIFGLETLYHTTRTRLLKLVWGEGVEPSRLSAVVLEATVSSIPPPPH